MDLRGVKCRLCDAIGAHFEDACPMRYKTGVPTVLQVKPEDTKYKHVIPLSATWNPTYVDLPWDYLPEHELMDMVRRRPNVPSFLRCAACGILVEDPVWLSCCDLVVCGECVGPAQVCPACSAKLAEPAADTGPTMHRVGALRTLQSFYARYAVETSGDPYVVPVPAASSHPPSHPPLPLPLPHTHGYHAHPGANKRPLGRR